MFHPQPVPAAKAQDLCLMSPRLIPKDSSQKPLWSNRIKMLQNSADLIKILTNELFWFNKTSNNNKNMRPQWLTQRTLPPEARLLERSRTSRTSPRTSTLLTRTVTTLPLNHNSSSKPSHNIKMVSSQISSINSSMLVKTYLNLSMIQLMKAASLPTIRTTTAKANALNKISPTACSYLTNLQWRQKPRSKAKLNSTFKNSPHNNRRRFQ